MQLRLLAHARSLIPRKNHEHTLARQADTAQSAAGVSGELLRGGPSVGRRCRNHLGFELVEPGEDEGLARGQHRVGIRRAHDEGLLDDVTRTGALGLKPVRKGVGNLEALKLHPGGVDVVASKKGEHLLRLAPDLGLSELEIVSRSDEPQWPEREIRRDLLLRQSFHFNVRLGRTAAGETAADEAPTERETKRNSNCGSRRA
jgi:hypothetical protein